MTEYESEKPEERDEPDEPVEPAEPVIPPPNLGMPPPPTASAGPDEQMP